MASTIELLLLAQSLQPDTQVVPSGGQLVNATSYTAVFAWPVTAGVAYRFRAAIFYTANATAGTPSLELFAAAGAVVSEAGYNFTYMGGGSTPQSEAKTAFGAVLSGPAMTTAGYTYQFTVEGTVTFSTGAASGFRVSAATSNASDTWTIQQGSLMTCVPLL